MNVIKATAFIDEEINGGAILRKLERAGRTCYKSEGKSDGTLDGACKFISSILKRGHESVIEHQSITARFICDRGVSHEIVRHRIASYSQESTRYCNYSNNDFGSELTVIEPCFLSKNTNGYTGWETACLQAEISYFELLEWGCTPQEARSVLPNSLKTEVVMTANLREWRHFFKLRCSKAAHPQMREVALILLKDFKSKIPVIFDDLAFNE